jgi:hypothetical protein
MLDFCQWKVIDMPPAKSGDALNRLALAGGLWRPFDMDELDDIIVRSGEQCRHTGIYLSNGCGHTERLELNSGSTLPNCSICNKPVSWIPKLSPESQPHEPPKSFLE